MKLVLAIAAGGALGAVARHFVAGRIFHWLGMGFPWGTLAVNVIGSLILGALVQLMALRWSVDVEMRAFLVVGLLGGFTTFSAFSLDAVALLQRGEFASGAAYVAGSVLLSIIALFVGMTLLRAILT